MACIYVSGEEIGMKRNSISIICSNILCNANLFSPKRSAYLMVVDRIIEVVHESQLRDLV